MNISKGNRHLILQIADRSPMTAEDLAAEKIPESYRRAKDEEQGHSCKKREIETAFLSAVRKGELWNRNPRLDKTVVRMVV